VRLWVQSAVQEKKRKKRENKIKERKGRKKRKEMGNQFGDCKLKLY
jgi:hypothetical protein